MAVVSFGTTTVNGTIFFYGNSINYGGANRYTLQLQLTDGGSTVRPPPAQVFPVGNLFLQNQANVLAANGRSITPLASEVTRIFSNPLGYTNIEFNLFFANRMYNNGVQIIGPATSNTFADAVQTPPFVSSNTSFVSGSWSGDTWGGTPNTLAVRTAGERTQPNGNLGNFFYNGSQLIISASDLAATGAVANRQNFSSITYGNLTSSFALTSGASSNAGAVFSQNVNADGNTVNLAIQLNTLDLQRFNATQPTWVNVGADAIQPAFNTTAIALFGRYFNAANLANFVSSTPVSLNSWTFNANAYNFTLNFSSNIAANSINPTGIALQNVSNLLAAGANNRSYTLSNADVRSITYSGNSATINFTYSLRSNLYNSFVNPIAFAGPRTANYSANSSTTTWITLSPTAVNVASGFTFVSIPNSNARSANSFLGDVTRSNILRWSVSTNGVLFYEIDRVIDIARVASGYLWFNNQPSNVGAKQGVTTAFDAGLINYGTTAGNTFFFNLRLDPTDRAAIIGNNLQYAAMWVNLAGPTNPQSGFVSIDTVQNVNGVYNNIYPWSSAIANNLTSFSVNAQSQTIDYRFDTGILTIDPTLATPVNQNNLAAINGRSINFAAGDYSNITVLPGNTARLTYTLAAVSKFYNNGVNPIYSNLNTSYTGANSAFANTQGFSNLWIQQINTSNALQASAYVASTRTANLVNWARYGNRLELWFDNIMNVNSLLYSAISFNDGAGNTTQLTGNGGYTQVGYSNNLANISLQLLDRDVDNLVLYDNKFVSINSNFISDWQNNPVTANAAIARRTKTPVTLSNYTASSNSVTFLFDANISSIVNLAGISAYSETNSQPIVFGANATSTVSGNILTVTFNNQLNNQIMSLPSANGYWGRGSKTYYSIANGAVRYANTANIVSAGIQGIDIRAAYSINVATLSANSAENNPYPGASQYTIVFDRPMLANAANIVISQQANAAGNSINLAGWTSSVPANTYSNIYTFIANSDQSNVVWNRQIATSQDTNYLNLTNNSARDRDNNPTADYSATVPLAFAWRSFNYDDTDGNIQLLFNGNVSALDLSQWYINGNATANSTAVSLAGSMIYNLNTPNVTLQLSASTKDFLDRTAGLWDNRTSTYLLAGSVGAASPTLQQPAVKQVSTFVLNLPPTIKSVEYQTLPAIAPVNTLDWNIRFELEPVAVSTTTFGQISIWDRASTEPDPVIITLTNSRRQLSSDGVYLYVRYSQQDWNAIRNSGIAQSQQTTYVQATGTPNGIVQDRSGRQNPPFFGNVDIFEQRPYAPDVENTVAEAGDFDRQAGNVNFRDTNWGLIRHTAQTNPWVPSGVQGYNRTGDYSYQLNGEGVDVVVVDTGIDAYHPEFLLDTAPGVMTWDGLAFEEEKFAGNVSLRGITRFNNNTVAVGDRGTVYYNSLAVHSDETYALMDVCSYQGKLLAVGGYYGSSVNSINDGTFGPGCKILQSTTGQVWQDITPAGPNNEYARSMLRGCATNGSSFITVGNPNYSFRRTVDPATGRLPPNSRIIRYADGAWTNITNTCVYNLNRVRWYAAQNRYVAVGDNGTVLTSDDDGRSWTTRSTGVTCGLQDLLVYNQLLIAVGRGGVILLSGDGISWRRARDTNTVSDLFAVSRAANRFIALGQNGIAVVSNDGETWAVLGTVTEDTVYAAAVDANKIYTAVGAGTRVRAVDWSNLGVSGVPSSIDCGGYLGDAVSPDPNQAGGGHGVNVASIAGGKRNGWAKAARIYPIRIFRGVDITTGSTLAPIPQTKYAQLIRAFHQSKQGIRPTVCNLSLQTVIAQSAGVFATQINYRGQSSFTNASGTYIDAGKGVVKAVVPTRTSAVDTDLADAIAAGVIIIAAAGNYSYKQDVAGGADFNNSIVLNSGSTVFYHRGSSPGAAATVICTGALDSSFSSIGRGLAGAPQEQKALYSNTGQRVDIYAAGSDIMGAYRNFNYGANFVVRDRRSDATAYTYYLNKLSGTSQASPQIAGIAALMLQQQPTLNQASILTLLQSRATRNAMTVSGAEQQNLVNLPLYSNFTSLQGGQNLLAYLPAVPISAGNVDFLTGVSGAGGFDLE